MKKILLLAFVAATAFTSCKKDWTCECTDNGTSLGTFQIENKSKATAKANKKVCVYRIEI